MFIAPWIAHSGRRLLHTSVFAAAAGVPIAAGAVLLVKPSSPLLVTSVTPEESTDAFALIVEYLRQIRDWVDDESVEAEISDHLNSVDAAIFIARYAGEVCGCVVVHCFDERRFEIKRLYVRSSARGKGIASALMDRAEAFARERGSASVLLDTKTTMRDAIVLYERRGYERIPPYHSRETAQLFFAKELHD